MKAAGTTDVHWRVQTFVPSRLRGRFLNHRRTTRLGPSLLALLVACGDERSSTSPTIDDPPVFPARFLGVTYSDINTAWAFGEELTLLVSRDDGRSWQSATERVPPAYREFIAMERENEGSLRDLLFTSPSTAFLFALRRYAGSAAVQTFPVFVSRDQGMIWEVVESQNDPKFVNVPNPNVFGIRDGTPEILRRFMDSRLAVDDLIEPDGSDPIGIPTFDADLFVTSADRGWVAGLAQTSPQSRGNRPSAPLFGISSTPMGRRRHPRSPRP